MKIKMFLAVAAISVGGALVMGPAANAAGQTPTKVTIKAEGGGFYGYVKSADPANCADERKVTVYKLGGATPNPATDQKIGFDTASLNGDRYMYNTGNSGQTQGKFYARVKKNTECGGDLSRVVQAQN